MKISIDKIINQRIIWLLLITLVAALTCQAILLGVKTYTPGGLPYTHYNNYVIFKNSYFHLIENTNLYIPYRSEQFDLYKYSPSFALAMSILAYLPDWLGLFLWNFLNAALLFYALIRLPLLNQKQKIFTFFIIVLELITSVQNSQSNGLMTALMILTFVLLEKKKGIWAMLLLVISIYIKLFSILGLGLLIFYPDKLKNGIYFILWSVTLFLFPILVISWDQLLLQYKNWGELLANDESQSIGMSVAGIFSIFINVENIKNIILLLGLIILQLPLIFYKKFKYLNYRLLYLASLLIWVVIFNHKAESPTFIIAMCGVAIWFFCSKKMNSDTILLLLILFFTSICSTDIIPLMIRHEIIEPLRLKAVFIFLLWVKITWNLTIYKEE